MKSKNTIINKAKIKIHSTSKKRYNNNTISNPATRGSDTPQILNKQIFEFRVFPAD